MSSSRRDGAEVVIVGGGPVGMGLAIELGQRGVETVVVERYREPQPIPKGQNLTQRTTEHFHRWGCLEALRKARTIPREQGSGGLTAYGTLLGPYHYDWLQRELVRPFYFTDNERLPQYATEAVLRARAAALPTVRTLYGLQAERVAGQAGEARVEIRERGGSGRRELRGRFVVGCDGSRSLVRREAGIGETRSDHDRLMVLLVFRSGRLHELLERFPGKCFFNVLHPDLKGYWRFFGRVDAAGGWFFHAPVPPGTTRDNYDFSRLLFEAVGAEFDVAFDHIGFWDLRIALADRYRSGSVFLAGDAAHSHPPYGGYGINTGFEDAANLGWKLAAALQGWAGPALLDSYEAERRPVFASTARDFIEKAIAADRDFLAAFDPARDRDAFEREWDRRRTGASAEVSAFEPNYEGSPIVAGGGGRPSAVGAHDFAARPGHHLAPQPLSDGRNVFEALGPGFTLLALDAERAEVEVFKAAGARRAVPLEVLCDSRAAGRSLYGARLVLVRPDGFVAWSGNDAAGADAVVGRAIGGSSPERALMAGRTELQDDGLAAS